VKKSEGYFDVFAHDGPTELTTFWGSIEHRFMLEKTWALDSFVARDFSFVFLFCPCEMTQTVVFTFDYSSFDFFILDRPFG